LAKSPQTFRKRQREQKMREKARLKRERREQRRTEKKESADDAPQWLIEPADVEPGELGPGAVDTLEDNEILPHPEK
jgi:hypothetical protein